jgi:hypothetical protein
LQLWQFALGAIACAAPGKTPLSIDLEGFSSQRVVGTNID